MSVVSTRKVLVFPAPFGPTRPKTSPGGTREREIVHGHEIAVVHAQPADVDRRRRALSAAA